MGWVLSKYEYNDIFYATSLLHFDVFFLFSKGIFNCMLI